VPKVPVTVGVTTGVGDAATTAYVTDEEALFPALSVAVTKKL
jgi:hypothetical protein